MADPWDPFPSLREGLLVHRGPRSHAHFMLTSTVPRAWVSPGSERSQGKNLEVRVLPLPHWLLQRQNLWAQAFPALKSQALQGCRGASNHQRPGRELQKSSCQQCGSLPGFSWKA